MSRRFAIVVVGALLGCVPDQPPASEHPCQPENHCVRADGQLFCEEGYTWQDPDDEDNYVCVPVDDESLNEGVDCREQACQGLFYCELSSGACLPGCATSSQCAALEVCELASHSCECGPGAHACGDACVDDTDVATCGDRCSPCPADPNGDPVCRNRQCAFACHEGYRECASGCCPFDCQPGATRCDGDRVQTCTTGGTWGNGALCDTACREGACTECAPGAETCLYAEGEPAQRAVCSDAGTFEPVEECAAGCAIGVDEDVRCYECHRGYVSCGATGTRYCNDDGRYESRTVLTSAEYNEAHWNTERRTCGDIHIEVEHPHNFTWTFRYEALSSGTLRVAVAPAPTGFSSCPERTVIKRDGAEVFTTPQYGGSCVDASVAASAGDTFAISFSNPSTSCACNERFDVHAWIE